MKLELTNKDETDTWLKENAFEEPTDLLFKLRLTDDEKELANMSIAEIHAHFIKAAINFIETGDYFDDYDDFVVSSKSEFDKNDGEKISYRVEISVEKEN